MREPERETAPIDRSGEWVHPAGRADPAIGLPKPQSVVAASRGLELDELARAAGTVLDGLEGSATRCPMCTTLSW
jgi:hypothetical protein